MTKAREISKLASTLTITGNTVNTLSVNTFTASAISANGSVGTSGQVLTSNGSKTYWSSAAGGGGVTSFSGGSTGLTPSTASNGAITLGGTLYASYGGTGTSSTPQNGQILIGSYGSYAVANLTAGSGVSIVNGPGSITISATGGSSGPTIKTMSVTPSGYNSLSPSVGSQYSAPLVTSDPTSASPFAAAFVFNNHTGFYNITSASLMSFYIQDSTGNNHSFTSGTDFDSSPGSFRVDDKVVSCWGLSVYSSTMKALFYNTYSSMTSPNLGPNSPYTYGGPNNPSISVSTTTGTYSLYSGSGIVVEKSTPTYYVYFGAGPGSPQSGLSVNSIQFTVNGSMSTYYSGSDFSAGAAEMTSYGMFQMSLSVFNGTMATLLDNSFRSQT